MIEIRQLKTSAEIGRLASYRDDAKDDLLLCDYGQFVQWLARVVPAEPDKFCVLCAVDQGRIVAYIVLCVCRIDPVYNYGTVIRLSCHEPDALRPLGGEALDWGRARGVTRVVVSTYDSRAKDLYERVFGFGHCGYQLDRVI